MKIPFNDTILLQENISLWYFWKPLWFRCPNYKWDGYDIAKESRKKISEKLSISEEKLIFLNQSHSSSISIITDIYDLDIDADAAVTNIPGVALGVLTSDCLPIFFYESHSKIVGVIHAGWKGIKNEIIIKSLKKSQKKYWFNMRDVRIYIGPHICERCYEVGVEFLEIFWSDISKKNGKYFLNLKALAITQLRSLGIEESHIVVSDSCTYENKQTLHSYRCFTHTQEVWYANNAGIIMINE